MSRQIVIGVELKPECVEWIKQEATEFEVIYCPERDKLGGVIDKAEILFSYGIPPAIYQRAENLRWINSASAGVDQWLVPEVINSPIILTNSSGAHGAPIAELILSQMLNFATGMHMLIRAQMSKDMSMRNKVDEYKFELEGQTLGVIGLGSIGDALARKAKGLDMRVLGLKRNPGAKPPYVDTLYGSEGMADLLRQSDHVALCLPLTDETQYIISEKELALMKPSAYIYNIGRGGSIDQDALIRALQEGRIAGAGLDVTTPEPLPPDSPLWEMPNVMLSLHTSGGSPKNNQRITELFIENLRRYQEGQPLLRMVDKQLKY